MVPVMTRFGPTALAAVTVLAVGSCSVTATTPAGGVVNPGTVTTATKAITTSPAVAATTPATAPTSTDLTFPRKSAGEVARAIYVPRSHTRTLWQAPNKGSYVVRAACSASAPGAAVTYEVLDSRPSTAEDQRLLSSGQVPCDGTVTVNGASPLVGNAISVDLTNISGGVTRAYAVVVPE